MMGFANPQNSAQYCWFFIFDIERYYNWGYLVLFAKCLENREDRHYQESDTDICASEGGMQVKYVPGDKALPYRVACIDRKVAMESEASSCWKVEAIEPALRIRKVIAAEEKQICGDMLWSLVDGSHISTTHNSHQGGITNLERCNGGLYREAIVEYVLWPTGEIVGFGNVHCVPNHPPAAFACLGVANKCIPISSFHADKDVENVKSASEPQ